jgi:chromosome segregation protein
LKACQRQFFGYTYSSLKTILNEVMSQLNAVVNKRQALEHELAAERKKLDVLEGSHGENAQYRRIQEELRGIQDQKNKLLEDLSVVRGKMQSQKTSVGDPKTLQVELHQKTQAINEAKEKLAATQAEHARHVGELEKQNHQLRQITDKLNQLYNHTKNPVQIDWALFDLELESLDKTFQSFYQGLETATDMSAVRGSAEQLAQSFGKFRSTAKDIVRSPEASMAVFQKELQHVLAEKEKLGEHVRQLELEASRASMNADFLAKQIHSLDQERLHLDLELKKASSVSLDEFLHGLIAEEDRIKKEVEKQGHEVSRVETSLKAYYQEEEARRKEVREAENAFRARQDEHGKLKDEESKINIEKAKLDTQMQVLLEEISRILGLDVVKEFDQQPVTAIEHGVEEKLLRLKNQLDMIGGMDELTLKEYQETETRYTNLSTQVEDLRKGMTDLRSIMDELDGHIKTKFNESFHKINEKFEFYFRVLFNGGRAYLSVVKSGEDKEDIEEMAADGSAEDSADTASDLRPEEKVLQKYSQSSSNIVGIDIKATPPGKKLATIQALSGGERALTSIALLCSLLTCFPSPFVVLDEVDAALDDANTIRFGQILGTLSHQTQFITITHNRETMAQAIMLYGVTMGDDGVSKLLSVKVDQAAQYAK